MISTQMQTPTLEARPDAKDGVTLCAHCGIQPAAKKFCSSVCRQAAYRLSPAHRKNLDKQKTARLNRRNRWYEAKMRDKSFGFDGRYSGHEDKTVPSLGNFERFSAEAYLSIALQQVLEASHAI